VMGFGTSAAVAAGAASGPVAASCPPPTAALLDGELCRRRDDGGQCRNHGSSSGSLWPLRWWVWRLADGGGYWLVASDGGIFAFGDAAFHGSMGGHFLDAPVVGMAASPDGGGYWLVASDGGIFAFGDAASMVPWAVMRSTSHGGYGRYLRRGRLLDGGVRRRDLRFRRRRLPWFMGGHALDEPMVGMAATSDGGGYWTVASDGGIFPSATHLSKAQVPADRSRPRRRHGVPTRRLLGGVRPDRPRVERPRPAGAARHSRLPPARVDAVRFIWRWQTTPSALKRMWAPARTPWSCEAPSRPSSPRRTSSQRRYVGGRDSRPPGGGSRSGAGANPYGYTYAVASENIPRPSWSGTTGRS